MRARTDRFRALPAALSLALFLAMAASPAAAQLNENCTVSLLNRTAQVNAAGFWRIDNVPAAAGLVRARAVCIENGTTRIGVSGWLQIPPNGMVFSNDIVFQAPPPVPARLTLTAAKTTLQEIGSTVQLTVAATYPNGSTASVTAGASGTNYTTSNPRVMTVSPNGLVTAVGAGAVIISASNDGALGLLRLAVSNGPIDTDGDGMPDDWETTNGLDPNDPADGARDADDDGLMNLDEYRKDTDPLNPDTDGDGIRDGLEVQTGSDPTNPGSYNLSGALRSIAITPAPVNITVNPILGASSRLVKVIGTLIDNNSIDLTARSRGTAYTTANSGIAFFSAVDGLLLGGANGSTTITATNNGFSASATVNVNRFTPASNGTLTLPAYGHDIAVSGNHLFVADSSAGLQIINLTSRQIVGSYPTKGRSVDVIVSGNLAYVAELSGGVQIIDVSVPSAPQPVTWVDTPGTAFDLAVSNGYVFVADGTNGLVVIDARTPATASIVTTIPNLGNVRAVDVEGNRLAVYALTTLTVYLYDVTAPPSPALLGTFPSGNGANETQDLLLRLPNVYIGGNSALRVINFSNPAAPALTQSFFDVNGVPDFTAVNGLLIGAHRATGGGASVVDVSNPSAVSVRSRLFDVDVTNAVAADAKYIYRLTSTTYVEPTASTTAISKINFLEYVRLNDNGLAAPAVRITEPANGSPVVRGATIPVSFDAADDVGVLAVELLLDDAPYRVSSVSPYSLSAVVPPAGSSMTFVARATDGGNNVGISAPVTVQIVEDTVPPAVTIGALTSPLTAGTNVTVDVTATDNASVTGVTLYANGILVGTDATFPYSFVYKVQNDVFSIAFRAEAADPAGNVGIGTRTVAARPDPVPVVTLMTPTASQIFYTGAEIRARVRATDNTSVRWVELLVNGVSVDFESRAAWWLDDSSTDYELYYQVPDNLTSVTVQAVAYDNLELAGYSAPVTLTFKPTSALGAVALNDLAWDLDVRGNVAYIATGSSGLTVADVSNPSAPVVVATLDTPGDAREILVLGNYAILGERDGTIHVIDVSTPTAPAFLSSVFTAGTLYDMTLYRDRLYVGTDTGLFIVSLADAGAPRVTRHLPVLDTPKKVPTRAVRVEGDLLLRVDDHETFTNTCSYCATLTISDLSDPDSPVLRGRLGPALPHWNRELEPGDYVNLTVSGNRAYILGEDWVVAADISDPSSPKYVGNFDVSWRYYGWFDMDVRGPIGLAAWSTRQKHRVWMTDLRNPQTMMMSGSINMAALGPYHGTAITSTSELVYTTGISAYVNDVISGVTTGRLYTGRFETIADTNNVAPSAVVRPAVLNAFEYQTVPVSVTATDDVGVASVTLSMNGVSVETDRTAPFDFAVAMPAGAGSYTLVATATDYAGTAGQSAPVTITTVADTTPPAITLTSPVGGESLPSAAATLAAAASDNFAVAKVEFYVGGALVATDTSAPYHYGYTFPAGVTSVNVIARAYDRAGNYAETPQTTAAITAPQTTGTINLSTFPYDVAVNGDHAYVITPAELIVVNVTGTPAIVSATPIPGELRSISILGHHAFIHRTDAKTSIVDISSPGAPVLKSTVASAGVHGASATGTRLYTGQGPIRSYDFSNPVAPVLLRTNDIYPPVSNLQAYGNLALGRNAGGGSAVEAIDMANPVANASGILSVPTGVVSFALNEGRVAVAGSGGLVTTNVDDRFSWSNLSSPGVFFEPVDIADRYIVSASRDTDLYIFDATNFRSPFLRYKLRISSPGTYYMNAIAASPTHIVVGMAYSTSCCSPHRLYVMRYRTFTDTAGAAPVVTLNAPASGKLDRLVALTARATDDVFVKGVVFSINGVDVYTDTVAPFEFNALMPASGTSATVGARAIDFGGNSSTIATATVTLTP